jgi:hypothetical protein
MKIDAKEATAALDAANSVAAAARALKCNEDSIMRLALSNEDVRRSFTACRERGVLTRGSSLAQGSPPNLIGQLLAEQKKTNGLLEKQVELLDQLVKLGVIK